MLHFPQLFTNEIEFLPFGLEWFLIRKMPRKSGPKLTFGHDGKACGTFLVRHPGCCRSLFWVPFCRQDAGNEIRILCLPHFSLVLGLTFFVCYLLITLVYIHFV